mgnify:FL=1
MELAARDDFVARDFLFEPGRVVRGIVWGTVRVKLERLGVVRVYGCEAVGPRFEPSRVVDGVEVGATVYSISLFKKKKHATHLPCTKT